MNHCDCRKYHSPGPYPAPAEFTELTLSDIFSSYHVNTTKWPPNSSERIPIHSNGPPWCLVLAAHVLFSLPLQSQRHVRSPHGIPTFKRHSSLHIRRAAISLLTKHKLGRWESIAVFVLLLSFFPSLRRGYCPLVLFKLRVTPPHLLGFLRVLSVGVKWLASVMFLSRSRSVCYFFPSSLLMSRECWMLPQRSYKASWNTPGLIC